MNYKKTILSVALFWWLAAPSLFAQDFLKQLEETILKRQAEAKAKESDSAKEKQVQAPLADSESSGSAKAPPPPMPVETPLILNPPDNNPTEQLPRPKRTPRTSAQDDSGTSSAQPSTGSSSSRPNRNNANKPATPRASSEGAQSGGGYLGMTVESTPGGGFGLDVTQVTTDSPAWKGGFRTGDKLIGVDGTAVSSLEDLAVQLAQFSPGVPVRFLVERNGRNLSLSAVLMDRNIAKRIQTGPNAPVSARENEFGQAFLGASLSDMSDGFRRQFGIGAFRGVSVTDVVAGSPAAQAGLRPGDCIVSFHGKEVTRADEVQEMVAIAMPGELIELAFYRGAIIHRGSAVLQRISTPTLSEWEGGSVTQEMLNPEYVAALQAELDRVSAELMEAKSRMKQLESRLQRIESQR